MRLDCARVTVPLDWTNPGGAKITLSLIRHRASRPWERIGTLHFNPGGPGACMRCTESSASAWPPHRGCRSSIGSRRLVAYVRAADA